MPCLASSIIVYDIFKHAPSCLFLLIDFFFNLFNKKLEINRSMQERNMSVKITSSITSVFVCFKIYKFKFEKLLLKLFKMSYCTFSL